LRYCRVDGTEQEGCGELQKAAYSIKLYKDFSIYRWWGGGGKLIPRTLKVLIAYPPLSFSPFSFIAGISSSCMS